MVSEPRTSGPRATDALTNFATSLIPKEPLAASVGFLEGETTLTKLRLILPLTSREFAISISLILMNILMSHDGLF